MSASPSALAPPALAAPRLVAPWRSMRTSTNQLVRPTASVDIDATPATVFAVLTDPRTYPEWLLGAQRIRAVDLDWPAAGSAFHHTVGFGPLQVHDRTTVLRCRAPYELRLDAHIGIFGNAEVTFRLFEIETGRTRVTLREVPRGGVARLGWRSLARGWLAFGLWGRNQLTLDRLRSLIEAAFVADAADH